MRRLKILLLGAFTFVAAQGVLSARWQTWFRGNDAYAPWFMHSNRTVAFTILVFGLVGTAVSLFVRRDQAVETAFSAALYLALGGAVPMVYRLFTMRGGPGNLFPIAIAIGFVVLAIGSLTGVSVGWWIRRAGVPHSLRDS